MTATPEADTHTRLTLEDLRNFDGESTKLVLEMQVAGWTGYITNRGHAFMLAPDGTTTASVTRDSLRGRSGRNARAQLTRWQRIQREAEQSKPGRSFGSVDFDEPGIPPWHNRVLPIATLAELKRSTAFNDFMTETRGMDGSEVMAFVAPIDVSDNPRTWAAFDIRHRANPVLVALGSQMTEEQAWAMVYDQHQYLRLTSTTSATHTPEDQAMKVYVCKNCDAKFESLGTLGVHAQTAHDDRRWTCELDGCGKSFGTAGGLNLHRNGAHPVEVVCPEDECNYTTVNRGALARHRVKSHGYLTKKAQKAKDKAGEFTVSHIEPSEPHVPEPLLVRTSIVPAEVGVTGDNDTVTSPPIEPTGDVLMDYLLASPEGEDAEDIVAKMRALLAAPIVRELRRLREENALLTEQVDKLSHDNGDLEAKLSIMREALAV